MEYPELVDVPLHRVAHARTGDKGDRINIALICYHPDAFSYVVEQVTEEAVLNCYAHRNPRAVQRYLLPRLAACNFVIDDVLAGGVNNSLCLDRHGKGLSYLLLAMPVKVPRHCLAGKEANNT
jgi:hypothetical protein